MYRGALNVGAAGNHDWYARTRTLDRSDSWIGEQRLDAGKALQVDEPGFFRRSKINSRLRRASLKHDGWDFVWEWCMQPA